MPVYEGGAGVPTPGRVQMVVGWVAPPDEDEDAQDEGTEDGAGTEPDAGPAAKSRGKKAGAGA